MANKNQNRVIDIPVLSGSYFDLTKFDFSFKDIYILNIESDEFKNYLERITAPDNGGYNYAMVSNIVKEKMGHYGDLYAVIKRDPFNDFNRQEIYRVWTILLIIHPSDLQIQHELHFHIEGQYISTTGYSSEPKSYTGEYPGMPLFNDDRYVAEINAFILLVFERLQSTGYIGLSIYHYLTSYKASHYHYQFMSLFTALDCIIGNGTELQYRLKRAVAILCGDREHTCNIILKKVETLSKIRNDIVHGNSFSGTDVFEKLPKLRTLVSRVIIELLIHNLEQKKLNEAFTKIGFGDRSKISKDWKEFELNLLVNVDAKWLDFSKPVSPTKKQELPKSE